MLYPNHFPLGKLQKGALAALSAIGAVITWVVINLSWKEYCRVMVASDPPSTTSTNRSTRSPERVDLVGNVAETTGEQLPPRFSVCRFCTPVGHDDGVMLYACLSLAN